MNRSTDVQRTIFSNMGHVSTWGTDAAHNPSGLDIGVESFPVYHAALQQTHRNEERVRAMFPLDNYVRMMR